MTIRLLISNVKKPGFLKKPGFCAASFFKRQNGQHRIRPLKNFTEPYWVKEAWFFGLVENGTRYQFYQ
jgi:hypothetical protein